MPQFQDVADEGTAGNAHAPAMRLVWYLEDLAQKRETERFYIFRYERKACSRDFCPVRRVKIFDLSSANMECTACHYASGGNNSEHLRELFHDLPWRRCQHRLGKLVKL